MNKKFLREEYELIRKEIENKEQKSYIISDKILQNEFYKNAKIIAIYESTADEVNTESIIKDALKNGKIVAIPKAENKGVMNFYRICEDEKLTVGRFGIKEPLGDKEKIINKEDIDLIIVPGICFDKGNARIGYGGGYYDRYLCGTKAYKIGICFKEQIVGKIEGIDAKDVKMDIVITD